MNSILLGDFNLNFAKKNDVNYLHVKYFEDFDDVLFDKNLIQIEHNKSIAKIKFLKKKNYF